MRLLPIYFLLLLIIGCQKGPVSVNGIMVQVELLEAARHNNFDYTGTLSKVLRQDENAMDELLRIENYPDTLAANQHASVLASLIQRLGDDYFARQLTRQPEDLQQRVWAMLDHHLQKQKESLRSSAPNTWKALTQREAPTVVTGLYKEEDGIGTLLLCGEDEKQLRTIDETGALNRNYKRLLRNPYPGQAIVAEFRGIVMNYFGAQSLPDNYDGFIIITEVIKLENKNFRNTCIPYELWALGNEPYWQAQASPIEGVIEFSELGVERTLYFPYASASQTDSVRVYSAVNSTTGDNIEIRVFEEKCSDTMAGNAFQYRVAANVNGRRFIGCGLTYPPMQPTPGEPLQPKE